MTRWLALGLLGALFSVGLLTGAQDDTPVPTLVPPTPLPITPQPQDSDTLAESALVRVQQEGVLRVGILYNEAPFGVYTVRGEVSGYDADIARAMAEAWGVEVQFVQVTRQNRFAMLRSGAVDLLLAALVHHRDDDAQVGFSQTYHIGRQAVMVRAEDELSALIQLANRRIGYVRATPSESALRTWQTESGLPIEMQSYLTLDRAYGALFAGEIDGVVGRHEHLLQVSSATPEAVTILDEPLLLEPYAIGLRRYDVPMRELVNRTLQYWLTDADIGKPGTLEQLHSQYFPGSEFPYDALPVYASVGEEAPSLASSTISPLPNPVNTLQRLAEARVLRVAGVQEVASLPPTQQPLAQINLSLVQQLASRWGLTVEQVAGDPIQLLESGQADLAVGITPDWSLAERVSFSQPYARHGERLLIPENRDYERFGDLRGRIVATINTDTGAQARADAWASSINVRVRFFETTQEGAVRTLLEDRNADVLYADSLLLLPILQANSDEFRLGPSIYSREYLTLALPRAAWDFRLLVNYTLQDMAQDGALNTILLPITPPGETLLQLDVWPGSGEHLAFVGD